MSYCAFFDLDETILNCKTMVEVYAHYHRFITQSETLGQAKFERIWNLICAFRDTTNAPRSEVNKVFYRTFYGIEQHVMQAACQDWFHTVGQTKLNPIVCEEIRKHQDNGAKIVIVSGSFEDCVQPIAQYLGISDYLCAQLCVADGHYTGEMHNPTPVIGEGKAISIKSFTKQYNLPLTNSYAYGDHDSDLPMLSLADHPVVVGDNHILAQHAQSHGWAKLTSHLLNH